MNSPILQDDLPSPSVSPSDPTEDPLAGGTINLEAEAVKNLKCKRGKTKQNGTAPAAGERRKQCKRKVDTDVDDVGEEAPAGPKSEPEGDAAMNKVDNRDGCAESSHQEQGETYGPAVHPPSGDTSFCMHKTKIVGSVV